MPAASPEFLASLKAFAGGETSRAALAPVIDKVLRTGPQVVLYDHAEPDIVFGAELDAAMYLDMDADDGAEYDEIEARRLAGSLATLLEVSHQSDPYLADLLTLTRSKLRSVERLRAYASGDLDRGGFERFVARRPWSSALQNALLQLPKPEVACVAGYLESDEWASIADLLHDYLGLDF